MRRGASARYIFSGILKCAECGSNLTIISARGKDRRTGYYGCPGHLHRGICTNNVYERRDLIEKKLLEGIREKVLQSAALDYPTSQLRKGFAAEEQQEQVVFLKKKEAQLRLELTRLAEAIASGSGSKTLMQTLSRKRKNSSA